MERDRLAGPGRGAASTMRPRTAGRFALGGAAGLPSEARQELKIGDSRTPRFKRDYPQLAYGYQIEALPGRRLVELVEQSIRVHMDIDALNESTRLTRAVRAWLTEHVQEAISVYEDEQGQALHEAILEEGELINEKTGEPFSPELVRLYLAEDDDADEEGGDA